MQDSTVLSHVPLLDVRPHGRNQDKPVCYCVVSCINIWDEEHAASSLVGSGPPGQDTDPYNLGIFNIVARDHVMVISLNAVHYMIGATCQVHRREWSWLSLARSFFFVVIDVRL